MASFWPSIEAEKGQKKRRLDTVLHADIAASPQLLKKEAAERAKRGDARLRCSMLTTFGNQGD